MKRLFIAIFILATGLFLVGYRNVDGIEQSLTQSLEESLQGPEYDGRLYVSRGILENKDINKPLYKIVNSQAAILRIMEDYAVMDTIYINSDVKGKIVEYYAEMVEGYEELRFGTDSDRYCTLSNLAYTRYETDCKLTLNFNSKQSKEDFYGRIGYMNKQWVDLLGGF